MQQINSLTRRHQSEVPVDMLELLLSYLADRVSVADAYTANELSKQAASDAVRRIFHEPIVGEAGGPVDKSSMANRDLLDLRRKIILNSGLFDESYYLSGLSNTRTDVSDPIMHYLTEGWLAAKDPNPLFSVRFYLWRYADVRKAGFDPLTHYIECGSSEMRDPHPLFLNYFYATQHSLQTPPGTTWLRHFLAEPASTIVPHPIFDVDEYASRAGIDSGSARDALIHYLTDGWRRGVNPSPFFRSDYYDSQIGGQRGDIEPYTHYALFGVPRGLNPHPLFDTKYYRTIVTDFDTDKDPLIHYMWKGETDGVPPSPLFDTAFYRSKYHRELSVHGPFWHYLTEGSRRDHLPNHTFDPAKYRHEFMERGADDTVAALEHFVRLGWRTSRNGLTSQQSIARNDGADVRPSSHPKDSEPVTTPGLKEYPGKFDHLPGRPNVLLVAHAAAQHLFGSERSLLDMLDGLASNGMNVFVALPRNVPDYTNMIRPKCERVFIFQYEWWRKGEASSDIARKFFRDIIQQYDIHAVHANTIMVRECLEAARDCGAQAVVHVRELITQDEQLVALIGEPVADIVAAVHARSDWIIGNSQATAQALSLPGRTYVIANTVDVVAMDIPNPVGAERIRFGLISSNIPKKGLFDLVEVAREADQRGLNADFLIIGPDTPEITALKNAASHGDLPNNIIFAGYAATPRDGVAQVHVVLNLSNFAESFGRTVLEAMAARRPVIAYAWGALTELIEHGVTGFLSPFRDTSSIVNYAEMLCRNPSSISELGAHAREAALNGYSPQSYSEAFRDAYRNILPQYSFDLSHNLSEPLIRPARKVGLKDRHAQIRIAYFCWHFPVPSETFVLNELRVLVESGADVVVFCRQIPYPDFDLDFHVRFERVENHHALAQRLLETGRTIVHAHFTFPTVTNMVWPACEAAEIPFTFIAHAQDIFVHKNDEQNRLAEIGASPWCLKLFTLSRFHLEYVVERGFPRNKVIINPNAVALDRFATGAVDGHEARLNKRVVAVHRFVEKKGLGALIKAGPLVKDLGITIEIYGYGPLEDEYRRLAADEGAHNVTIHGQISQNEVLEVLKKADLFACPSVRTSTGDMDGIPTSMIESMAAQVPVLGTLIAGTPDILEDGITGIVCDSTPESIAASIRRFYGMHTLQVRAIIDEARKRVSERHDAVRLVETIQRVWGNVTVDIVVVTWNNLRELRMVIDAILANTVTPYHLIICDNMSRKEPVGYYLDGLWEANDHVTVVHNNRNAMVGPGTNLAMAQGSSDHVIYVCGKEGVSFCNGWEMAFVRAFVTPDIGLVGSIGYSPSYLTGAQYPTGIRLFSSFRNKDFATANPNRNFGHVQGGLFAISRRMIDEIGGFSDDVPHDYTDVEYSFYAESRGWQLAEADHVLALFNKSRPSLSQRFRDDVVVAHPVLPNQVSQFRAVTERRLCHCNICDWYGEAFDISSVACPQCQSHPLDRSLFRWLSDSTFLFRRLPALAAGLDGKMQAVWAEQFQGPRMTVADFVNVLKRNGRLPNSSGRLQLAMLRIGNQHGSALKLICAELGRVLAPGATLVIQIGEEPIESWDQTTQAVGRAMESAGFRPTSDIRYASASIGYSYLPITVFRKTDD